MIVLCAATTKLAAQQLSNLRQIQLVPVSDTIKLDSLSIIPGSLIICDINGHFIDTSGFRIDYPKGLLIVKNKKNISDTLQNKTWFCKYRVFPLSFTTEYRHKDYRNIHIEEKGLIDPFVFRYETSAENVFQWSGLNKSGSISRGLSFGNNQDVVVNSSLNLQLSGHLSEDINVLAAITDNNIPIQPDGNTQQIQEFDKVYIQLFNKNFRLTAGDFEITRPESYFMNVNRKAQGGSITTDFNLKEKKEGRKPAHISLTGSAAVSKGKYSRNQLNGIEGNQGPYKLTGANNETFIIVLAGTEKVYIDGRLLTRGQENDYVIDYNVGEISFTPKNIITKDKRIIIEFEYSEKSYARSMFFAGAKVDYSRVKINFNFFSEQDVKSQPVQQDLSDNEKRLLQSIGDSLNLALVPAVDSVQFSSDLVLYKMIDTTVNTVIYDSIFQYSVNADSAHYKLAFSFVGAGRGNYIQIQSAANGRVFKWVAPQNGQPSGSYEPVILLVTPKKKQMYSLGIDYAVSKTMRVYLETALSNNDLNTFSTLNSNDDIGYAAKAGLENRSPIGKNKEKGMLFVAALSHEYVNRYFTPIERYRAVEFERDWNMNTVKLPEDEHISNLKLGFENTKNQYYYWQAKSYFKSSEYSGIQNMLNIKTDVRNFFLEADGSYLTTNTPSYKTAYIKQKASLIKKFKWVSIGLREEQEDNRFNQSDTLLKNSFGFNEYGALIASPDSAKNKITVNYKRRYDYLAGKYELWKATTGDDFTLDIALTKNPNQLLKIGGSYRKLKINDSLLSTNKPDNTLIGRIEYNTRLLKGSITSNTFYEAGSGLEVKKEFSYLEVLPGQGLYSFTDYNGNGVKELNEFEVSAFKDQANYIRIFTPTNDYIKSYSNQFSEVLNIDPAAAWSGKNGFRKFASRFALQTGFTVEHKSTDKDLLNAYNPFRFDVADSTLLTLNSSFRSVLFFNRGNAKFGMDVSWQDNRNKMLMVNGVDSRELQKAEGKIRWNITRVFGLILGGNKGIKSSNSEYFGSRDFSIDFWETEPRFTIQPGTTFRISLLYSYKEKINTKGSNHETAQSHNIGMEIKYNMVSKGSLLAKANYLDIGYNATENNSLAYEMLEGFKKGKNATWSLSFQRNLSENLQLNIIYDGRQSPGSKMVHVGSMQLRAYF